MIIYKIQNSQTGAFICDDKMNVMTFDTSNGAYAYMALYRINAGIYRIVAEKIIKKSCLVKEN